MAKEVKENVFDFEKELIRKEVFETLETSDKEHPVLIFNPNKEQRKLILNLIVENLNVKDDEMKTNISGYDLVFKLLPELTNVPLKFDVNNPEDQEKVSKIVDDPSDLFIDISRNINKLINKYFYRYYEDLKELSVMPSELRDVYIESIDKIKQDQEKTEEISEKEKRRLELEEELKKLNEEGV